MEKKGKENGDVRNMVLTFFSNVDTPLGWQSIDRVMEYRLKNAISHVPEI